MSHLLDIYRPLLEAIHFRPQGADEREEVYLNAALVQVAQLPEAEQQPLLDLLNAAPSGE